MRKYLFAIIITLTASLTFAGQIPLQVPAKAIKISDRFREVINNTPVDQPIKAWVFFTDKGIFDETGYKTALAGIQNRFAPKAIQRRSDRSVSPGLDFYDIPVFEPYLDSLRSLGAKVLTASRWLNAASIEAESSVLNAIADKPFVAELKPVGRFVRQPEPTTVLKPSGVPIPDSLYGVSLTQVNQIKVPVLQKFGYSGKGVLIAFFDTGFKLDHPVFDTLRPHVLATYDFINGDSTVTDSTPNVDQLDHGTLVLSACGGFTSGTLIGPSYGADYILAKTEIRDTEIVAEEFNWVAASEWADSIGADIISSSLGYNDWYTYEDINGQTAPITIAADIAATRGIAVFNAAGNERCNSPANCFYYVTPPADGFHVMAVGAVDYLGNILAFSSAGPTYDGRIKPDIVAMGSGVVSAHYTGGYTYASGTSLSTPLAAGAAGLLLEVHPGWGPAELDTAMKSSADRYENPDNLYGWGLFNTFKAADLFHLDPIAPLRLAVGDSVNIHVTVSKIIDSIPILTLVDPPVGASLTDSGNGAGLFTFHVSSANLGATSLTFVATVGPAADTLIVPLTVTGESGIVAGPNPFSDSVVIFLGKSGELKKISIHAADGGKVWENFSDNYNSTRGTVVWRGVNDEGKEVAPGVYFLVIQTDRELKKIKVFKK
ncbi:putative Subtilisin [Candidatus Zixiibacteriota bacterium]|nr:putative Subtilisin [candidate division Zixibacteria bacterium]